MMRDPLEITTGDASIRVWDMSNHWSLQVWNMVDIEIWQIWLCLWLGIIFALASSYLRGDEQQDQLNIAVAAAPSSSPSVSLQQFWQVHCGMPLFWPGTQQ